MDLEDFFKGDAEGEEGKAAEQCGVNEDALDTLEDKYNEAMEGKDPAECLRGERDLCG